MPLLKSLTKSFAFFIVLFCDCLLFVDEDDPLLLLLVDFLPAFEEALLPELLLCELLTLLPVLALLLFPPEVDGVYDRVVLLLDPELE